MSTPNSDRERALEVARGWMLAPFRTEEGLADLIQRENAAAFARGERAMRERAAEACRRTEREANQVLNDSEGRDEAAGLEAGVAQWLKETIRALPPTAESEPQSEPQPEPRVGDVWMVPADVLVAVGDLAHVCITVENEEHCIALAADWLREKGRLLSRKEGGA